ncbi:hypothetical protein [Bradyrhizobium sp. URHA0013]|uniref:hypothetical protein n=1 Tax=Bradyrhizobium sp. URHA0013 TaxID=1380352 RepID=UPI001AEC70CB|nr:hypothetical protein [Bradyrhizobium sp. URHA0013]
MPRRSLRSTPAQNAVYAAGQHHAAPGRRIGVDAREQVHYLVAHLGADGVRASGRLKRMTRTLPILDCQIRLSPGLEPVTSPNHPKEMLA